MGGNLLSLSHTLSLLSYIYSFSFYRGVPFLTFRLAQAPRGSGTEPSQRGTNRHKVLQAAQSGTGHSWRLNGHT